MTRLFERQKYINFKPKEATGERKQEGVRAGEARAPFKAPVERLDHIGDFAVVRKEH